MGSNDRPTKEQVRVWFSERRQACLPPPSCKEIRRQLGWQYSARGMRSDTYAEEPEGRK